VLLYAKSISIRIRGTVLSLSVPTVYIQILYFYEYFLFTNYFLPWIDLQFWTLKFWYLKDRVKHHAKILISIFAAKNVLALCNQLCPIYCRVLKWILHSKRQSEFYWNRINYYASPKKFRPATCWDADDSGLGWLRQLDCNNHKWD